MNSSSLIQVHKRGITRDGWAPGQGSVCIRWSLNANETGVADQRTLSRDFGANETSAQRVGETEIDSG